MRGRIGAPLLLVVRFEGAAGDDEHGADWDVAGALGFTAKFECATDVVRVSPHAKASPG